MAYKPKHYRKLGKRYGLQGSQLKGAGLDAISDMIMGRMGGGYQPRGGLNRNLGGLNQMLRGQYTAAQQPAPVAPTPVPAMPVGPQAGFGSDPSYGVSYATAGQPLISDLITGTPMAEGADPSLGGFQYGEGALPDMAPTTFDIPQPLVDGGQSRWERSMATYGGGGRGGGGLGMFGNPTGGLF